MILNSFCNVKTLVYAFLVYHQRRLTAARFIEPAGNAEVQSMSVDLSTPRRESLVILEVNVSQDLRKEQVQRTQVKRQQPSPFGYSQSS
jgi:hypothetical protein